MSDLLSNLPPIAANGTRSTARGSRPRSCRATSRRSCAASSPAGRRSRPASESPPGARAVPRGVRQRHAGERADDAARGRRAHLLRRVDGGLQLPAHERTVTQVLEQVLRYSHFERAPAVARAKRADRAPACPASRENVLPLLDGERRSPRCGSAPPSPRRRISTSRTTSPAASPAGAASRCCRSTRSPTCTSARSTTRPPARRCRWSTSRRPDFDRFPRFREALAQRAGGGARAGRRASTCRRCGGITCSRSSA